MMKRLLQGLAVLALLAGVLVITVLIRADRRFEGPLPAIAASNDPAVIARGAYIAYGPGHCVNCHTNDAEQPAVLRGEHLPLAGGHVFELPLGNVYSPNLTPDHETGIGRYSDAELARVLRYGVLPDGHAALPFMEFHDLSDDDLTALVSFLRAQKPVRRAVPDHKLTLVGKGVMAFLIKPIGPKGAIRTASPRAEATVERGEYLATSVAGCVECHTTRNMLDGSYTGAMFGGGLTFDIPGDAGHILVTPNLTRSNTSHIAKWSEDQFVARFRMGVGREHSHMPWRQYQQMSESDVRAIYRYLRTVQPSSNDPGPIYQAKK